MTDEQLNALLRASIARARRFMPVRGFEQFYEVTDDGRVRAHARRWATGNHGNCVRIEPARWLKLQRARNGYLVVNLKAHGKAKTMLVHRLVAEAFIPNPDGLPHVNHRNLRRHDNRAANLEWSSAGDNKRHSASAARTRGRFAYTHPRAAANDGAFTEEQSA